METLKIIFNNIRGLGMKKKRLAYFQWLRKQNFDIICLQETFITEKNEQIRSRDWDGKIFNCKSNTSHGKGVSILLKNESKFRVIKNINSLDGRKMILSFEYNEKLYNICNIYAPNENSNKKIFFKNLKEWILTNAVPNSNLILGGDFNTEKHKPGASNYIKDLMTQLKLKDTFNTKISPISYTYFHQSGVKSRIDFILVTEHSSGDFTDFQIRDSPAPDHKALIIKLNNLENKRGPSYWKLNIAILKDENYQRHVKEKIKESLRSAEYNYKLGNYSIHWDLLKIKIRDFSIQYCKKIKRARNNELAKSERKLRDINEKLRENANCDHLEEEKKIIMSEIEAEMYRQAQAYQIRSRAEYVEKGEKNTSYFLNLEKLRQQNNTIKQLRLKNGNIVTSNTEILLEIKKFLQNFILNYAYYCYRLFIYSEY